MKLWKVTFLLATAEGTTTASIAVPNSAIFHTRHNDEAVDVNQVAVMLTSLLASSWLILGNDENALTVRSAHVITFTITAVEDTPPVPEQRAAGRPARPERIPNY